MPIPDVLGHRRAHAGRQELSGRLEVADRLVDSVEKLSRFGRPGCFLVSGSSVSVRTPLSYATVENLTRLTGSREVSQEGLSDLHGESHGNLHVFSRLSLPPWLANRPGNRECDKLEK
jgi:hypothetical protein